MPPFFSCYLLPLYYFSQAVENFSNKEIKIEVKDDIKDIACRNISLENLNNISLEDIIKAEFQGTWQDVVDNKIPAINFELAEISPYSIGQFMAFFQYATFYSALLREVNPCDQPGVEEVVVSVSVAPLKVTVDPETLKAVTPGPIKTVPEGESNDWKVSLPHSDWKRRRLPRPRPPGGRMCHDPASL